MKRTAFKFILLALTQLLNKASRSRPAFRAALKQNDCIVQFRLKDGSAGRHYFIAAGKVRSTAGIHPKPDVTLMFKDIETALRFLSPKQDYHFIVHAVKNFKVMVLGPDALATWFMQTMNLMQSSGLTAGTALADGVTRYTAMTNGGPLFVHVKNGRILRLLPIELDDSDGPTWTIQARGRSFSPHRRAMLAPHALSMKSTVYSDKRLLYPMKRVDFDPKGERNPQNRGISGYERISWDEALEIVSSEILRQRQTHGPGSITFPLSSHHQWGNVGYYLSSLTRFANLIGFTRVAANPDSWEGWYWGAMHHHGASHRLGITGNYGTVVDCLEECELMVLWSSDPESTNAAYAGFEGTQRRLWAKSLGIEFVHIDPNYNPTAQLLGGRWIPIKPTTDPALAIAIMQVWVEEKLYDTEYVELRTTGFAEWRDYLMGTQDGVAKTPEWQQLETGVPAKDVRALARLMARKKTYIGAGMLGSGFGGACRSATGAQWARCMVMLMAMRGWGKPGVNFGNLQAGAPINLDFYFPGYADGGISGDLNWTGNAVNNYQRMPHVITVNPVQQLVPRQDLPDAIITGKASGYLWDGMSPEAQFQKFEYPKPGYSRIHMIYRYGSSQFSTVTNSSRFIEAYRHDSIEFVVNQSIWREGETQFADIILPACTSFERWDISEWSSGGGYVFHGQNAVNHRIVTMQHKCIEPLGESKSDYRIFSEIAMKLGVGAMFTEGCSELDWVKRVFDSSEVPDKMSWKEFLQKGYYVVPAEKPELREPVNMRWFAEGRMKDVPEPFPLPSQWSGKFGYGLPTTSGKFEFMPSTLQRADPDNPERPVLNRYISAWEGSRTAGLVENYPLQLITSHSRFSFHTHTDGKSSTTNDIGDHRALIDGHYYWLLRITPADAASRGIRHRDLVKVFNTRGAVICAADLAPIMAPGVVKASEASAEYTPVVVDGEKVDIGGCMNLLTSSRSQMPGTSSMAPNSCLVQVAKWTGSSPSRLQAAGVHRTEPALSTAS